MTENEKALRECIDDALQATGKKAKESAHADSLTCLDALLAERRAEVERLTAERDEARRLHGALVLDASKQLSSARDAVLEEAKGVAERCAALGFEASDVADHLEGLKSRPAERHLPEPKVREALNGARAVACSDVQYAYGWNEALRTAGRRLGINLDAPPTLSERVATSQAKTEGHKCQACCGLLHQPTSGVCSCPCDDCIAFRQARAEACRHCASTTRITNDIGDERCSGCGRDWATKMEGSPPGHALEVPRGFRLERGHVRDADGCTADCPGCATESV